MMTEKVKAAISYFLSAAAYIAFGVDKLTAADMGDGISLAIIVVGAVASALGVFWTAPSKNAADNRFAED
jgi:hypothetical protein